MKKQIKLEIVIFISSVVVSLLTYQQILMLEYVYRDAIRETFTYLCDLVIMICGLLVATVALTCMVARICEHFDEKTKARKFKSRYFIDMK